MKSLTTDFFNKGKKKGQRGWMAAKGNFCLWSRERGRRQFCESQSWSDRSVSLWETNHLDEEKLLLLFIALNLVVRKQIFVCTVLLSLVLSLVYYRKLVSPLSKFRLHASFFCFEQKPIRILSQTQVELQEPPSRRVNILDIQGSGQKGQFSILFFYFQRHLTLL